LEEKEEIAMTAEITLQNFMTHDYPSYEFVRGRLTPMPPTTMEHGEVCSNIVTLLEDSVRRCQLGKVYTAPTVFRIGSSGRKPDVAFVAQERLPDNRRQASPIPPDLAIEVVSPSDKFYDVQGKVFEYLDAGTQMVWVIDPVSKTVSVYRSRDNIKTLTQQQTLTGEDVVEGFQCSVSEVFE
jgi:Uma2 family endonuclease